MDSRLNLESGELPAWISKWTRRLLSQQTLNELLPELLAEIGNSVSADRCYIYRAREATEIFDLAWEWCAPGVQMAGEHLPVLTRDDMPVLGERVLNSEVLILSSLDELPAGAEKEKALLSQLGIESLVSVPFSSGDQIAGFLGVQSVADPRKWDDATVTLLSAIAGVISVALDQHEVSIQEERLHGFFEASVDLFGIADPDSKQVLYLNPAGRALLGMKEGESLEKVSVDRVSSKAVMKRKENVIYPTVEKEGSWRGESTIRTLNTGEEIPVLQTWVRIPFPECASGFAVGTIMHDLREEKAFEQRMTDSERLLRDLVTAAPHALYMLNYEDSRMVFGEEGFARLMGYSVEEMRNFENGLYDPIHPADLPAVQAQEALLAEAEDGKVLPVTFRFRRKDGHWDWVEVHSKVFERDADGRPISEVGMAQIVTGRKLAEDQLRRSEERIEMAVAGTTDGLWDSDLTTGKDWWSRRVYEMLGYDDKEIPPEYDNSVKLLHPDDRQRVKDHLDSHLRRGTTYDIEYRNRMKSGEYRWFRGRGQAIWDTSGIPVRMAGSIQDIHQRKLTELKLRREAEINRVMLHVMNGFTFVIDPEGRTVRWNRAAKELTGFSDEEFRKKPIWDLLFPAGSRQRAEVLKEIGKIKHEARFFQSMRKIWKKGGSTRIVEYQTSGIYTEDGELLNIVLVGFDLSSHFRLQREVIRIAEQEQLRIGADLHDGLGQTLTGVGDLIDALTSRLKEPRDIEISEKIHTLVRTAISEVRRMSRGLTPASIEEHGLAGSLKILAESVEDQSGIICTADIDPPKEIREIEVITQLFRIAQEAVNNAVKHSGGDTIEISLKETNSETILTIDDNGVGINSGNSSGKRGVGLTVMDYRAGLMGGTVTVADRPNRGTRVECRLPFEFDRLDRLNSGKVYLYKAALEEIN